MVPCRHTCHHVSMYSFLDSLFQFRWVFVVVVAQDGNLRALVTSLSLLRLPLSGTTFLLTSDTAVLSHSSWLLLEPFALLLPTLSYSNRFTGIGCCTWFSSFADILIGWVLIIGRGAGGWTETQGEGSEGCVYTLEWAVRETGRERKWEWMCVCVCRVCVSVSHVCVCVCVCVCAHTCVCTCVDVGESEG